MVSWPRASRPVVESIEERVSAARARALRAEKAAAEAGAALVLAESEAARHRARVAEEFGVETPLQARELLAALEAEVRQRLDRAEADLDGIGAQA